MFTTSLHCRLHAVSIGATLLVACASPSTGRPLDGDSHGDDGGVGRDAYIATDGRAPEAPDASADAGRPPLPDGGPAVECAGESLHVLPAGGRGGDGSDWTRAFDGFTAIPWGDGPGEVGAGDCLFVGRGAFEDVLDIGASGAEGSHLVILRATQDRHGSDLGWSGALDGQAVLRQIDLRGRSHVTVDGAVDRGILITNGAAEFRALVWLAGSDAGPQVDVTLQRLELIGPGYRTCIHGRGIRVDSNYSQVDRLTVRGITAHEFAEPAIRLINHEELVIEDSALYNIGASCSEIHSEHIAVFGDIVSPTIRNNLFYQAYTDDVVDGGFAMSFAGTNGVIRIFNNVFYNTAYGVYINSDGFGDRFERIVVYGNTFVGYRTPISSLVHDGNASVANNIFCNPPDLFAPDHTRTAYTGGDHNMYCADTRYTDRYEAASDSIVLPEGSHPFVDIEAMDFHLRAGSAAIDSGSELEAEFAFDRDHVNRPQGEGWDRGAYEAGP